MHDIIRKLNTKYEIFYILFLKNIKFNQFIENFIISVKNRIFLRSKEEIKNL